MTLEELKQRAYDILMQHDEGLLTDYELGSALKKIGIEIKLLPDSNATDLKYDKVSG